MAEIVYLMCALTSACSAGLLLRGFRRSRSRLLFWSSLSFLGLAINNTLLFIDLVVVPSVDMSLVRSVTALVSVLILAIGLIWENR